MLEAGSRVGDYEIESQLGQGGMATVYRARHVLLDTHHAVKILDPELRRNAEARQRFLDEAKIQAKHLDHPGIVKVTNIVATADYAALVMELVEGTSLEDEVGKLAARPDEIRRIMIGVLEALGSAHDAGIVHRDLKPANVLLAGPKRQPKVTDFGIAKATRDGGSKKKSTHAAARMGTLNYMSPEQVRSAKNVTARSDIFSLGAMLYELATGALPFDADNDFDLMEQIVNGRYVLPAKRNPSIDPAIAAVIERALKIDPEQRFPSCAEMAAALGAAPVAPVKPIAVEAPPSSGGKGMYFAGVGVIAIAGGITAIVALREEPPSEIRAPTAADLARYTSGITGDGPLTANIETDRGTFHCELFADKAPRTVANFIGLATGQKPWREPFTKDIVKNRPFYDGQIFHRAVADFAIQGGDPVALGGDGGGPGYVFDDEIDPSLKHGPGTLAMWSVGPNKNGSQFAIYERTVSELDGSETIFGRCTEAWLARKLIADVSTKPRPTIKRITITRGDAPEPRPIYAVGVTGFPSRGPATAKVTLVRACDYASPYCLRTNETLAALRQFYGDDLRIVERQLVIHPETATTPAIAACAADLQGRFGEMDERLWNSFRLRDLVNAADHGCWATENGCTRMITTANLVGLDLERFVRDMKNTCPRNVERDTRELTELGLRATPSFFINGRHLSGAKTIPEFKAIIDEELKLANDRIARGATVEDYYRSFVLTTGKTKLD